MDTKVLDRIFESIGLTEKLQNADIKEQVSAILEEIVNSRVEAMTQEFSEKEKALLSKAEEAGKELKDKEAITLEEVNAFVKELHAEMAHKEAIMLEEVSAYKEGVEGVLGEEAKLFREEIEKAVLQEATQHRTAVENIMLEAVEEYKQFLEGTVLEQAASFTSEQEEKLAKEVHAFKESMVKRVSEYFESELPKHIPKNIMESAVKLSAYQPLIEGVIDVFGKNYVKLDSQSFDVIKEVKAENERLSESVNAKIQDNVRLQASLKNLEKKSKINELTEGMTTAQKGKMVPLLESCSTAEEITNKFNATKDLVINESVKNKTTEVKTINKPVAVISENLQKKVELLKGSTSATTSSDPEMAGWIKKLNEQRIQG
jgi:hypothetical protein